MFNPIISYNMLMEWILFSLKGTVCVSSFCFYVYCGGAVITTTTTKKQNQHIEKPWGMREHWIFKDKTGDLKAKSWCTGPVKNVCLYPKNNKISLKYKYCKQRINTTNLHFQRIILAIAWKMDGRERTVEKRSHGSDDR